MFNHGKFSFTMRLLFKLISIVFKSVCAQLQCTSHPNLLPIAVRSSMIGYSNVSKSVYLVGGKNTAGSRFDEVYKWDTDLPTSWFADIGTPAPTVMETDGSQIMTTIDEVIYIVAPRNRVDSPQTTGSAIYRFDTATEQWLPDIPFTTPLGPWLHSPCVTHNRTHIFAIDGYISRDYRDDDPIYILIYSILRNEFTTHTLNAPFGNGRVYRGWYGTYCSYANSHLYIFGGMYYEGGSSSSVYSDAIYRYEIAEQQFFTIGTTLPTTRRYGMAVYDGVKYIYLVGGYYGSNRVHLDAIRIFDVDSEQLLPATITTALPVSHVSSMILDKQIWLFGGRISNGSATNVVQKCNISSFSRTTHDATATPTQDPTSSPTTTSAPSPDPSSSTPPTAQTKQTTQTTAASLLDTTAPPTTEQDRVVAVPDPPTPAPTQGGEAEAQDATSTQKPTNTEPSTHELQSSIVLIVAALVLIIGCLCSCMTCIVFYFHKKHISRSASVSIQMQERPQAEPKPAAAHEQEHQGLGGDVVVLVKHGKQVKQEHQPANVGILAQNVQGDARAAAESVIDPNHNYKPEGDRASFITPNADLRNNVQREQSVSSKTRSSDSSLAMHEDHWAVLKVTNYAGVDEEQKLEIFDRDEHGEQNAEHPLKGTADTTGAKSTHF